MFRILVRKESLPYILMLSTTALILNYLFPPSAIIPFIILFIFKNPGRTSELVTFSSCTEVIVPNYIQIKLNTRDVAKGSITAIGVVE